MPTPLSKELLEELLTGKRLTDQDIDALILRQPDEDEYLDYKNGVVVANNLKKARGMVREYVSGFANAEGGVLMLGIAEPPTPGAPRFVSGCVRPGGTALDVWTQNCLTDMVPYFSPQPRVHVVAHPKGEILVAAVGRAPQLVPCLVAGEIKYYLRMGQSTLEAPPYLLSDLVLGRRQHPMIDLRVRQITVEMAEILSEDKSRPGRGIGFGFRFIVENLSLASADEVSVGMLAWSVLNTDQRINPHLASYVDAGDRPALHGIHAEPRWRVQHIHSNVTMHRPVELRPFSEVYTDDVVRLIFPADFPGTQATFRAAVYVMPKGSLPTWFELSYAYWGDGERQRSEANRLAGVQLKRISGADRPQLSWEVQVV